MTTHTAASPTELRYLDTRARDLFVASREAHARWVAACDAVQRLARVLNADRTFDGTRERIMRPLRQLAAQAELGYNDAYAAWLAADDATRAARA